MRSEGGIVCGGKESNEGSSEHKPPSHAGLQGNVSSTCNMKQKIAELLKLFEALFLEKCEIRIGAMIMFTGSQSDTESKQSAPRVGYTMAIAPIWKSRNLYAALFYGHDFVIN